MINFFLYIIVCAEIWCRYDVDIKMFILLIVIVYMYRPLPGPLRRRGWGRMSAGSGEVQLLLIQLFSKSCFYFLFLKIAEEENAAKEALRTQCSYSDVNFVTTGDKIWKVHAPFLHGSDVSYTFSSSAESLLI